MKSDRHVASHLYVTSAREQWHLPDAMTLQECKLASPKLLLPVQSGGRLVADHAEEWHFRCQVCFMVVEGASGRFLFECRSHRQPSLSTDERQGRVYGKHRVSNCVAETKGAYPTRV